MKHINLENCGFHDLEKIVKNAESAEEIRQIYKAASSDQAKYVRTFACDNPHTPAELYKAWRDRARDMKNADEEILFDQMYSMKTGKRINHGMDDGDPYPD